MHPPPTPFPLPPLLLCRSLRQSPSPQAVPLRRFRPGMNLWVVGAGLVSVWKCVDATFGRAAAEPDAVARHSATFPFLGSQFLFLDAPAMQSTEKYPQKFALSRSRALKVGSPQNCRQTLAQTYRQDCTSVHLYKTPKLKTGTFRCIHYVQKGWTS